MPELAAGYPQLADFDQLTRILTNDNATRGLPPPGCTAQVLGFPESWVLIHGTPSEGDSETIWWTTLGEFAQMMGMGPDELVQALKLVLRAPVLQVVGTVALYPVTFVVNGGKHVRWIRTTMRGTLGTTVEQFQHKFDFGIPGNDPQITALEAQALAEDFAVLWKTAVDAVVGGGSTLASQLAGEVRYSEVGVVSINQDSPKNVDGTGGDVSQDFDTEWWTYVGALAPSGSGGVPLPYEVSCAVTFETDKRGPRGRGRIYMPPFQITAAVAGGVFTPTAYLAAGRACGKFFDDVKALTSYVPVVVSGRAKELHEINHIKVGKVPDAQRRRRRSQDELHTTVWTA